MKQHKSLKRTNEAHTANTKYGMGDYYGVAVKQKMGRMRDNYEHQMPSKDLGVPPKKLA